MKKKIKSKKKFPKESDFKHFFVKIPVHGTKTDGTSPGHDSCQGTIRDADYTRLITEAKNLNLVRK